MARLLFVFDTSAENFFFFNDTATTEIYTLSLHDALPILRQRWPRRLGDPLHGGRCTGDQSGQNRSARDRKSTRLNSSHQIISYAVFCLKKKNQTRNTTEWITIPLRQRTHPPQTYQLPQKP